MLDDEKEQKFIDLEELVRDLEERLTDLDNPEPEFLEIDGASRQVIVHWLQDTDVTTIVSLGDAKTEFLSQARAIDTTEGKPKVSHGDIMVIGGDCPWYAFCAQVDIRDDGAGFQAEDDITPPVAESDENADADVEREFIVWGGCGSGGGDDCPPGTSVSVAFWTLEAALPENMFCFISPRPTLPAGHTCPCTLVSPRDPVGPLVPSSPEQWVRKAMAS